MYKEKAGDEIHLVGYQNGVVGKFERKSDNGISCQRLLVMLLKVIFFC